MDESSEINEHESDAMVNEMATSVTIEVGDGPVQLS
jgi:hypothetical protein